MTYDEPPVSYPFQAVPADPADRNDEGDSTGESPASSEAPWDPPHLPAVERDSWRESFERDVYGDERGGQIPKRP
jgi:hypothetical protein